MCVRCTTLVVTAPVNRAQFATTSCSRSARYSHPDCIYETIRRRVDSNQSRFGPFVNVVRGRPDWPRRRRRWYAQSGTNQPTSLSSRKQGRNDISPVHGLAIDSAGGCNDPVDTKWTQLDVSNSRNDIEETVSHESDIRLEYKGRFDSTAKCKLEYKVRFDSTAECKLEYKGKFDFTAECKLQYKGRFDSTAKCKLEYKGRFDSTAKCKVLFS